MEQLPCCDLLATILRYDSETVSASPSVCMVSEHTFVWLTTATGGAFCRALRWVSNVAYNPVCIGVGGMTDAAVHFGWVSRGALF